MSYLDEWVDDSDVGAGVEDLVEVGLSVDQLQLVELLIVLKEEKQVISSREVFPWNDSRPGSGTKYGSQKRQWH